MWGGQQTQAFGAGTGWPWGAQQNRPAGCSVGCVLSLGVMSSIEMGHGKVRSSLGHLRHTWGEVAGCAIPGSGEITGWTWSAVDYGIAAASNTRESG